jgi:hypothetical protein
MRTQGELKARAKSHDLTATVNFMGRFTENKDIFPKADAEMLKTSSRKWKT